MFKEILENVRRSSPLIHCITNYVTVNDCANILLACGGSPIMVSTSGCRLISDEAMDALVAKLLPLGTVITPNIPETEVLCGFSVQNEDDMPMGAT